MVTVLVSESNGLGSSPGQGHSAVFLDKTELTNSTKSCAFLVN